MRPRGFGAAAGGLGLVLVACTGGGASGSGGSHAGAPSGAGGEGAATSAQTAAGTGAGGAGGAGGSARRLVDCSPPSGSAPALELVPVVTGLDRPLLAKASALDGTRLYVVEQPGRIRVVEDGVLLAEPFLDLTSVVTRAVVVQGTPTLEERGLLGLAFHPDYEQNGRFFVHYTDLAWDSVVAEYRRSSTDPNVADVEPAGVVMVHDQIAGAHNGGALEFGPDGMLYISFGDSGSYGDELDLGQSTSTWAGKILRVDVSTLPYGVPAGNLATPGAEPEIWDWGLRNPWRMTFDACTGDLYIGDVGNNLWEEIDVEPQGQGLRNYGWRLREGLECFNPQTDCDPSGITTPPVLVYPHSTGCAVIAGYVYRGSAIPALRGSFFYADHCVGRVWSFVHSAGRAMSHVEHTADLGTSNAMSIRSWGQDAFGELYIVDGGNGVVYRLAPE